jgi:hypothetical protein
VVAARRTRCGLAVTTALVTHSRFLCKREAVKSLKTLNRESTREKRIKQVQRRLPWVEKGPAHLGLGGLIYLSIQAETNMISNWVGHSLTQPP